MLIDANSPNIFWAEAAFTAVYLLNLSPTKFLNHCTPEEVWSGKCPDVSRLRIFGCKVHAHIPKEKRKKLDIKSTVCIMVGYSTESKAYRLYDPLKKIVFVSRDLIFFEEEKGCTLLTQEQHVKENNKLFLFPDDTCKLEYTNCE